MPPQEPLPPNPAPVSPSPQLESQPVQQTSAPWIKIAGCVIALLCVGGIAYAYKSGYISQLIKNITAPSTPTTTELSKNETSTTALKDYRFPKAQPAPDRLPNTIRFQFYGPSTLSGYGINGPTTTDTRMPTCSNDCNGTEELRLDIGWTMADGSAETPTPLASVSLKEVQKAYEKWVAEGKIGIFYSPVITVKLPTSPPQPGVARIISGHWTWDAVMYWDHNGNGKNDWAADYYIDSEVNTAASFTYVWTNEGMYDRVNKAQQFVLGWNYGLPRVDDSSDWQTLQPIGSNPDDIEHYRKSFESNIYQVPFLEPVDEILPISMEELLKLNKVK